MTLPKQQNQRLHVVFIAAAALINAAGCLADDGNWAGPNFRDFSGVCQANPSKPANATLWDKAAGWNRDGLAWEKWQPEPGKWNEDYYNSVADEVRAFLDHGVKSLIMLGYNTSWSSISLSLDTPYEVTYGDTWRREIEVLPDGNYDARTYTRANGTALWKFDRQFVIKGYRKNKIPLAPEHVKDWENYVREAVTRLRAEPINMTYFQVWNEAHPKSGFWDGSIDDYMDRVHLPAAKIIHDLGGKVVYGGWIHGAPVSELIETLDRHHAWETIDVLDVHYMPLKAFEELRQAADERGRPDIGIWQTELSNSPRPHFVSNNYPRFLYWSLTHNWDYADKYKLFFFSYKSPKLSERETAVNRTLYAGDDLSPHGVSLTTLGELLAGDGLRAYESVQSRPAIGTSIDSGASSIEAFAVQDRVIAAVHLGSDVDRSALTQDSRVRLPLAFPSINRETVDMVERVDIAGARTDLTEDMMSVGNGFAVDVAVDDAAGSEAEAWNAQSSDCRTFYVVVTLKQPQ